MALLIVLFLHPPPAGNDNVAEVKITAGQKTGWNLKRNSKVAKARPRRRYLTTPADANC